MKRILLALLVLTATSALAQPVGVEITPMIGYRTGGTIARDVTGVFGYDVQTDDSEMFGLIVDIDLNRYLQLELIANHQASELSYNTDLFVPEFEIGDMDVTYWQAGLIWRYPASNVQPFFGFTIGGATLDPKFQGLESENKFSGSMTGGVKIFFNKNVGVRFEARGYWTAIDDDSNSGCCYDDDWGYYDNDFWQGEAAAGLVLAF